VPALSHGLASASRALALCLFFAYAAAASAQAPIKPWTGGATPKLDLQGLDGRKVELSGLKGRVVLVNYWATWCEPCIEEMPSLERLQAKLRGRPFEVLAVNYGESAAKVSAFVSKMKLSLPVLLDPYKRSVEAWKVRGLPMTFLVDAEGHVRYWSFGASDWSEGEPLRLIERMMTEAPGA
jgi:cytochrome c biogenesis protein CcmG, thiol:disulfide interchange protein DsbE